MASTLTLDRSPTPADARGRPWLAHYDSGIPATIEIDDSPLHQIFRHNAGRHPQRAAIRFLGKTMTYAELDEAVSRFTNMLVGLGIRKGDRVAVLLPNCPQFVIAVYGTLRAGAIAVACSPLAAENELEQMWSDAEVRVVVCLSSLYPHVHAVRERVPAVEHVFVTNIKEYFPPLTRFLFTLVEERKGGHRVRLPDDGRTHWLRAELESASVEDPDITVAGDDPALLQPTGGTTGTPKLAVLTHRQLLANSKQIHAWFGNLTHADGADVVLGVIPLFHIYGMTTVLNFSLVHGATMVLQPRVVLTDVIKAVEREKVDFLPGIPTLYAAINGAAEDHRYDLRSLKAAISGAASLPQATQSRFEELTGARLVEGYGLTEASPVTHCNPLQGMRKIGSIGVPLPGTDAAIIDAESGMRCLQPGKVGELAIRGPQVMREYWHHAEETASVVRDGWLLTGDLVRMDEDGFFFLVDRKKDLIKTGGLNVFPGEVEGPLARHPKIAGVVVAGVPDERWGEAVTAFVVLKDGETVSEREIIDYCRGKMASYKVPKRIQFRASLPQTMLGKPMRYKLLQEERAAPSETPAATG